MYPLCEKHHMPDSSRNNTIKSLPCQFRKAERSSKQYASSPHTSNKAKQQFYDSKDPSEPSMINSWKIARSWQEHLFIQKEFRTRQSGLMACIFARILNQELLPLPLWWMQQIKNHERWPAAFRSFTAMFTPLKRLKRSFKTCLPLLRQGILMEQQDFTYKMVAKIQSMLRKKTCSQQLCNTRTGISDTTTGFAALPQSCQATLAFRLPPQAYMPWLHQVASKCGPPLSPSFLWFGSEACRSGPLPRNTLDKIKVTHRWQHTESAHVHSCLPHHHTV